MSLHPKVLVIGAGVSGLACARELTYRGYQVLVVEARERAGGRLHSISLGNTMVDVGGALIHGIQNNPVSSVCYQMGIPTRVVEECLLLEGNGIPVEPKHDAQVAEQFNACLEKTFENIQNTARKESSSFGQLFDRLSPRTKDPLFLWHQANLELSCGAPLNQLGYEWNDDEPYGYDGAHVSLTSGWKSVVEGLSEGLNIMYGSPIQQIRVVNDTASPRRSKRRRNGDKTESWDSKQNGDKVYVTLTTGKVLKADVVVCTLPLGILKIPPSSPGGIEFDPPLNEEKQTAIQQLGCGLLNKCAIQFPYRFWSDESDFLGVVDEKSWPHLILGGQDSTLIFMFGGEYAPQVELLTDKKVMEMCMSVLQKITSASVPPPLDYHVTRWSQDSYARGAFVYIPPASSMQDLEILSEPIVGSTGLPLVCFAGEHTTPYHPSTIHGAFNSGIREGYRLDLSFFPYYNRHLQFEPEQVYKKTFHLKRIFKNTEPPKHTVTAKASPAPRRRGTMTLRKRPRMNSSTRANPKRSLTNGYDLKPSRRSDRVQGIPAPAIQPTGSQEDRSLVRSYESCHNWQLVQSKVLPVYGDESGKSKSEAQLRARYQELKKTKLWLDPSITKDWLAPSVGRESERVNGRHTHRRKSRRTKKTRVMVDL